VTSVRRVAGDLDALRTRLGASDDPLVAELIEGLRTTVDQLQTTEEELERRNDELLDVHAALAAEARRFQLFFDAAPIAYLVTDRAGTISEANDAAAELVGTPPRFLLGKPLAALVDIAHRRRFRHELLALRSEEARAEVELRMRRRRGIAFDARIRALATGDSIMWAILDETANRQAEEQLWALNRELEERAAERSAELETVIDQIPVGLIVVGMNTRILRANDRARAMFGDDAEGRAILEWPLRTLSESAVSDEERPAVRAVRGETVVGERLLLGDTLVRINAVPIRSAAHVTGAVLTFEDVTAAERKARADREFVTNAAHQLRNPITAIASVVAALEAGAKDDPDTRDQFVAHIARDTARMTRTVESLLRLARLEREGRAPELRLVPLRPLLVAAADHATAGAGVEVVVTCRADVGATTNDGLVLEVLENLVANAIAHTERGGIELHGHLDGSHAVVDVADTGSGIPPGAEERIFERFYSGGLRTGAGLGLAVARDAAAAVGGSLEYVGTSRGRGATFRLTLPGARILR
jgi:PAS domain S-box-containing protein